ncbi:MAG: GNAT family N-acetyltransferase [Henriciella sp.]|nr:GNAT family N-acetyltransferase [Henriciella sp.]
MVSTVEIRRGQKSDFDTLGEVMFDAIHNGPTQYTRDQSKAWAPAPRRGASWADRLSGKEIFLGTQDTEILGFMTIEPGGYIDFAYIRPQAQGSGLFRRLFEMIERYARDHGETELMTHASLMAQPAFAAMGFTLELRQEVHIGAEKLMRAQMTKQL